MIYLLSYNHKPPRAFFVQYIHLTRDSLDRKFDLCKINAIMGTNENERKASERGQVATRTKIDASRRKHDFPRNTRYKNNRVSLSIFFLDQLLCIYITIRCASFLNVLNQFLWKMVFITCVRKQERNVRGDPLRGP